MDSKLVTIFGGTGFLGRHTVRALAKAGWRIKVAARRPARGFYLRPLGQVGQIDFVKCDIADAGQVAAAVAGSDAVINLCGILFQRGQSFEDVQANGAANIAEAAAATGVGAMVHVSAIGADKDSDAVYAQTKAAGEARVREFFPAATILRPSIVFGPEDDFFNRFAAMARMSPVLPLVGGGKTLFQPVFVGDVAAAIVTALGSEAAKGATYELGGPTVYSFKQLLQIVLTQTGRKRLLVPLPFGIAKQTNDLGMLRVAKNHRLKSLLGVHSHLAGDDADIRTGRVAEFHAEGFEISATLRRDAVRTDHHDRMIIRRLGDFELGLAAVIAHFANAFAGEHFHHLAVMDQRAIRVHGVTALLGILAGDIDGTFDTPTKPRGLGSDDLHALQGEDNPGRFKQSQPKAYLAGTPQTSAST
jgi:NADH dehydrogenase